MPVTWKDSVGTNHLTPSATPPTAVARGPAGTVGAFVAASTQHLTRASAVIDTTADFTVVIWAKFPTGLSAQHSIYGTNEGAAYPGISVQGATFGQAIYNSSGWGTQSADLGEGNADRWIMYVDKYVNSTTTTTTMAMGTQLNSGVWSAGYVQDLSAITSFSLGRRGNGTEYWTGNIGPSGVWSRALSDTEITALYNRGNGKKYADLTTAEKVGLVSYWNLDEVSGNRADSVVASANTLTDNATVGSVNSGPAGTVASLTAGSSEYFSRASGMSALDDTFSVGFWINEGSTSRYGLMQNGTYPAAGFTVETNVSTAGDIFVFSADDLTRSVSTAGGILGTDGSRWDYVFITYDTGATPRVHIYVNGVDQSVTETGGVPLALTAGNLFWLGRSVDGYSTVKLARVGIWSSVVSGASLFNSGLGKSYADLTAGEKVGLVSYWNLDETSGNRADSVVASGNTLTDNNTVGSVINAGGAMDGAAGAFVPDESLSKATGLELVTAPFTVSMWFKPTNVATGSHQVLIGKGNWSTIGWKINIGTAGQLTFNVEDSEAICPTVPSNGVWHHVIGWYNQGVDNKAYIQLDGGVATAAGAADASPTTPTQVFAIGNNQGINLSYAGSIDETVIWSRVLTAPERTALFNLGRGKFYPY